MTDWIAAVLGRVESGSSKLEKANITYAEKAAVQSETFCPDCPASRLLNACRSGDLVERLAIMTVDADLTDQEALEQAIRDLLEN
ncbi:MAG: hypothetical protein AAF530_13915 [Pseudomonadota bacterium]